MMNPISAIKTGAAALALALGGSSIGAPAPSLYTEPAPNARTVQVTQQEVDASNAKVKAAYSALVTMWTTDFKQIGERFDAPDIARYRTPVRTPCGVMTPNNAGYCAADMNSDGLLDGADIVAFVTAIIPP